MSLTVKSHWDDGKRIHAVGTIGVAANYATGGDTINFRNHAIKSTSIPIFVDIHGRSTFGYVFIPGTNATNGKVLARVVDTGVEVAAGAYPAGVTADTIEFHAIFRKLV